MQPANAAPARMSQVTVARLTASARRMPATKARDSQKRGMGKLGVRGQGSGSEVGLSKAPVFASLYPRERDEHGGAAAVIPVGVAKLAPHAVFFVQ